MIIHAVSDGLYVAEYFPSDGCFDAVCAALNLNSERLTRMYIEISRGPLDTEFLHAKITEGRHELLESGAQLDAFRGEF